LDKKKSYFVTSFDEALGQFLIISHIVRVEWIAGFNE